MIAIPTTQNLPENDSLNQISEYKMPQSLPAKNSLNFMDFSNFEKAWKTAEMISKARCIPQQFWDNPADVLVAIQYGDDLGLKPMQSVQKIMVVNNRPALFGDAPLALCMSHHSFIDCIETYDEDTETAFCTVKRKGREPKTKKFSRGMAERAGLWGKRGEKGVSAWVTNPERMLQFRARGFALRDMFADVLSGMQIYESIEDVIEHAPLKNTNNLIENNTAESMKERLKTKNEIQHTQLISEKKNEF